MPNTVITQIVPTAIIAYPTRDVFPATGAVVRILTYIFVSHYKRLRVARRIFALIAMFDS